MKPLDAALAPMLDEDVLESILRPGKGRAAKRNSPIIGG